MLLNFLYGALLCLASPWILWRCVRHGRYRRGWREKLLGLSPRDADGLRRQGHDRQRHGHDLQRQEQDLQRHQKDVWWLHAVSVGEVNLLPALVEELESTDPAPAIVISTSTDTGYDLAVKTFGQDRVFFAPLDFTWAIKRTLHSLQCKRLILSELELWPNWISVADRRGVTVSVINARMSQRSGDRYRKFAWLLRPTFQRLKLVLCQDEATRQTFIECGTPEHATTVTGSIKFDNAPTDRQTDDVQHRRRLAGAQSQHRVWVLGSSGDGEESMVLEIYDRLRRSNPDLRLVIVPRHAPRFSEVARLIESRGYQCRRVSAMDSNASEWPSDRIILVDTIGELRYWWGLAEFATVGGTFIDRGGQNMLEPAGYGAAVSFGPDTRNFRVIADSMLAAQAAVRVTGQADLERFLLRCLEDPPYSAALAERSRNWVAQHQGALDRTVKQLTEGQR